MTYRHFLRDLQTLAKKMLNCPYFYLSQFEHIFRFVLSVYFYAQIYQFREKNNMICIFAVNMTFLLSSECVVEKMSVSHANENEIYIIYFLSLKITGYR